MADQSSLMLNVSVLYRNTQKYFDRVLAPYDIGYGQLLFLLFINENEGRTMLDVTRLTQVDKGTTTKAVNKLIEQGYVQSVQDENDHRIKRLYTTDKTSEIMNVVYTYRNAWRKQLMDGVDFDLFEGMLDKITVNSAGLDASPSDYHRLRIGGMQKVTLLDYPGHLACTVFAAGCNFKCPYCHNRDLVFMPENYSYFDVDAILDYLRKRKGLLDGVCISGGEPLLQDEMPLIQRMKDMGYLVKLDTNGSYPEILKQVIDSGLVDYVAMDVKNSEGKYAVTCGMNPENFPIDNIKASISLLKEGKVDWEFRTTVVKELHTEKDIEAMGKWLKGSKHWYLQQFEDSGHLIKEGLHAYDEAGMKKLLECARKYVPGAELRGIREE